MSAKIVASALFLLGINATDEVQLPELLDDGINIVHNGDSIATHSNHYYVQIKDGTSKKRLREIIQQLGGTVERIMRHGRTLSVAMSDQNELMRWQNTDEVTLVEPMPTYHRLSDSVPYGITAVEAPQIWNYPDTNYQTKGNQNVVICVIDDGINPHHEDFESLNFVNDPSRESEWTSCAGCNHGNHVAGTIAAQMNGKGVVGVAPEVSIASIRVFNSQGQFSYPGGMIGALEDCAGFGAKIVSMSLGGVVSTQSELDAFTEYDGLCIAAAGNDGNDWFSYPASYPAVLSVGAIDSAENLASFSQRNDQVDLVAPGVNVLSTILTTSFRGLATAQGSYSVAQVIGSGQGDVTGPLFNAFGRCKTELNGLDLTGKVCHCRRGLIGYRRKVINAQNSGCAALVISNNRNGLVRGRIRGQASIPVLIISKADGASLEAQNPLNEDSVLARAIELGQGVYSGYAYLDGTSMACPHVSGVAGLLFSAVPQASVADVRSCMLSTAKDLGDTGRDHSYGEGMVQAEAALQCLINSSQSE